MLDFKRTVTFMGLITLGFCFAEESVLAQAEATKPANEKIKTPGVASATDDSSTKTEVEEEMVLDEILIEAVIEKPNVAILPSRELADLGDIEFINRSFQKELKAVPEGLFQVDHQDERKKSMDRLKNILKRLKK